MFKLNMEKYFAAFEQAGITLSSLMSLRRRDLRAVCLISVCVVCEVLDPVLISDRLE